MFLGRTPTTGTKSLDSYPRIVAANCGLQFHLKSVYMRQCCGGIVLTWDFVSGETGGPVLFTVEHLVFI